MKTKPLYVVKISSLAHSLTVGKETLHFPARTGYYSAEHPWQHVARDQADEMTHKQALKVRNHLAQPKIGLKAELEPA